MLRPIIARNYDSILCVSCDTAKNQRFELLTETARPQRRSESSSRNRCCSARMKWSS